MTFGVDVEKIADGKAHPHGAPGSPLFRDALILLAGVFITSVVVSVLARWHLGLDWEVVVLALATIAALLSAVLYALPLHPHDRFGSANLVTALRAALSCLIGAVVIRSDAFAGDQGDLLVWSMVIAACIVLAMDGLDGYLARRFRQESAFGARFDMEVDACLVLILSIAAFTLGKAGIWVMLIGGMRYGFVAAQALYPRLRGELAPSLRRKAICVVQVSALCLILVPGVDPPLSSFIAAAALAMLGYSFTVDIAALWMRARGGRA